MKVIETKIILATNTRPYRLKASDASGNKVIISFEGINTGTGLDDIRTHEVVATEFKNKFGYRGKLAGGRTKNGFAFVLMP